MGERHTKIGIQRELHVAWFEHAASVYAAGFKKSAARKEFYSYLNNASDSVEPLTEQTKIYISNALVKTWIEPDEELIPLRDAAYTLINNNLSNHIAIHWSLLSAAYPFWFNVASSIGRLLKLQDQVTQSQIVLRLKEKYGDRQTVSRRARYVIRSFVSWKALSDSKSKGCYERTAPIIITDPNLAILMFESALHATPEGKGSLPFLLNNPAFFPFQLPTMTGDFIAQNSKQIDVVRYGLDEELMKLKEKRASSLFVLLP
jgi:hypothetical protein